MSAPRYYQPRPIVMVPGLVHKPGRGYRGRRDDYIGSAEMIVAAGLATMDQLPGLPGNPISRAAYRPLGVEPGKGGWSDTPGYMTVYRTLGGKFRVELVVSREEQERRGRKVAAKAEQDDARAVEADEQERRETAWQAIVARSEDPIVEALALEVALQAINKARGAR